MKILHITTHLGGGVGDTILGYLSVSKEDNTIISLGYSFDYRKKEITVPYYDNMYYRHDEIIDMIPEFDIVLIHWWNHPLLYDFLVRNKLPKCRLIIWSHNSGLQPPNIYTKKIVDYPDILVFTSPLSYQIKNVKKSRVKKYNIWSTCGVDDYLLVRPEPHENFVVGYVGTIDYAKMHPDFLKMCYAIDIPDVKFVVVGKAELIEKEAKGNFKFPGFVRDLKEYYSKFDVFGYPLNPTHYGTCDLVLQIAMACGVVPVVMDNKMELTIVKHMVNGIVVKNIEEYGEAIKFLYDNPLTRKRFSINARKEAEQRFSLNKLNDEWTIVFEDMMTFPKTTKEWEITGTITAKDVFLESLGECGEAFIKDSKRKIKKLSKKSTWQSETKGTVHNYNSYFSDPCLKKWDKIMRENK